MRIHFHNDWKCVVQTKLFLIFHFSTSGFSGSHASMEAEPRSATARSVRAAGLPAPQAFQVLNVIQPHTAGLAPTKPFQNLAPTVHVPFLPAAQNVAQELSGFRPR